jgi:hypothetical protein
LHRPEHLRNVTSGTRPPVTIGDVEGHRHDVGAAEAEVGDGRVQFGFVDVGQRDLHAPLGARMGDAQPDAARRTGDERDSPGQLLHRRWKS